MTKKAVKSKPHPFAFLADLFDSKYPKVMEGVGRIAAALAIAEFYVDMIGFHLTGNFEAYASLTKSMSSGTKIRRVKEMCSQLIADEPLKARATTFCGQLLDILSDRNTYIHAIYLDEGAEITRVRFPVRDKSPVKKVTAIELFECAARILGLVRQNDSLPKDVERDATERRKKIKPSV